MARAHLAALAALLSNVAAAGAQTLATFTTWPLCGGCPTTLVTVDADTFQIVRSESIGAASGSTGLYVTPDGRFTLALETVTSPPSGGVVTEVTLHVRDGATGTVSKMPLPASAGFLAGNPTRAEVYVSGWSTGLALSPSGTRSLGHPSCARHHPVAISGDGRRLSFSCAAGGALPDVAVFDTATSVFLRSFPGGPTAPVLSDDGAEVYVVAGSAGAWRVRRYSMSDGGVLAEAALSGPSASAPYLALDRYTGRVLVADSAQTQVLDGATLQPTSVVSQVEAGLSAFDPYRRLLYRLVTRPTQGTGVAYRVSFEVLDADTLSVIRSAEATGNFVPTSLLVLPTPPAPHGATAVVQGGAVQVTWVPTAAAASTTRYVVEAGTAPGRADIVASLDVGLQTSLTASGVPPGTYYVRVRAANFAGLSAPSNEVVVQVP